MGLLKTKGGGKGKPGGKGAGIGDFGRTRGVPGML